MNYKKFQTMSKEEYFKKYNVGIRFLFGCDLNQKNETEMISLRVFLPKKHFQEYKNIDIFKTMDLFKETLLFKGLTEQSIKIDFEKREFVMPDFFIINDIEIIPYFTQGGEKEEELSKEKFFELLKQNKIKELNYLCFLFFGLFCEEEYKYFCLEDLNVKGMMSNHRLAKSISDVSFYEFKRQLEYKSSYNDKEIYQVDRFYPSSKLCSNCGTIKENLALKDRVYICDECGISIDRDYNASLNLLSQLKQKIGKVLAEFTPADLTALLNDLAINQIATSKVETGIQQKSYL